MRLFRNSILFTDADLTLTSHPTKECAQTPEAIREAIPQIVELNIGHNITCAGLAGLDRAVRVVRDLP